MHKYPSIFSPRMEAIVLIILQIFFATHAVLKIWEYLVNKLLQLINYEDNRIFYKGKTSTTAGQYFIVR